MEWKRGLRYEVGTLVQQRSGYVFIKTPEGMMPEHRWVASQKILKRPLREGEVVIRKTPDRADNHESNLVVVQHSLEKFKMLPRPNVIYVPREARQPSEGLIGPMDVTVA